MVDKALSGSNYVAFITGGKNQATLEKYCYMTFFLAESNFVNIAFRAQDMLK